MWVTLSRTSRCSPPSMATRPCSYPTVQATSPPLWTTTFSVVMVPPLKRLLTQRRVRSMSGHAVLHGPQAPNRLTGSWWVKRAMYGSGSPAYMASLAVAVRSSACAKSSVMAAPIWAGDLAGAHCRGNYSHYPAVGIALRSNTHPNHPLLPNSAPPDAHRCADLAASPAGEAPTGTRVTPAPRTPEGHFTHSRGVRLVN